MGYDRTLHLMMSGGGSSYVAPAVHFDGATQLATQGALLAADGPKSGIISCWFKTAWTSSSELLLCSQGAHITFSFGNGGHFCDVGIGDAGWNWNFWFSLTTNDVRDGNWHHFLAAWNGTSLSAYIDGADFHSIATTSAAYTPRWSDVFYFGGANGQYFNGDVADCYFGPGQYLDLSVEANRLKFRDPGGKPVDLGSGGSLPTGTRPALYLHGDASTFGNMGTGPATTVALGALTNAATHP
jgi:Concanavalin A-like lectin/glucanases superfamily